MALMAVMCALATYAFLQNRADGVPLSSDLSSGGVGILGMNITELQAYVGLIVFVVGAVFFAWAAIRGEPGEISRNQA